LAHEKPDAATECDAADADRAGIAEADREPVLRQGLGDFSRRRSGLYPGQARLGIDIDPGHVAQVDDQAAIGRAVADDAVAAAANRELIPISRCDFDDALHVGDARDAHDGRRTLVDAAIEDGAGLIVVRVVGSDDASSYT